MKDRSANLKDRSANLLGALSLAVVDRISRATRESLRHSGETPAALVLIGVEPGMSNDRLRRILGLSHPGTVRLVDRLVADGLVERRQGRDKREIALHLTAAGTRRRSALLKSRQDAIGAVLEPLDNTERADLEKLLHKLLKHIPTSEIEEYTICRLCNEKSCPNCPLPGKLA